MERRDAENRKLNTITQIIKEKDKSVVLIVPCKNNKVFNYPKKNPGIINGNGITNGNGIVNGNGLINGNRILKINFEFQTNNGLKNGCGIMNQYGFVNGNGLINGNGISDNNPGALLIKSDELDNARGIECSSKIGKNKVRSGIISSVYSKNKSFIAGLFSSSVIVPGTPTKIGKPSKSLIAGTLIIIFLLIALPLMVFLESYEKSYAILVDGKFNDWKDISAYEDSEFDQLDNNDVNILEYKIFSDDLFLSFYLKVKGKMFGYSNEENSYIIQIFIDTDLNKNSGYLISNIGADYMIEISGNDNSILSNMYYQFDNTRASNDWNAWETMFEVSADCKNNELETQIWLDDLGLNKKDYVNAYFHIFDSYGNEDFSDMIISNIGGALKIEQKSISAVILEKGKFTKFLELEITAYGRNVTINSIIIERYSTATDEDIENINLVNKNNKLLAKSNFTNGIATLMINPSNLSPKKSMTVFVTVNVSETAINGHAVGLRVSSIFADTKAIIIYGKAKVAYIENVPDKIVVDGAFEDWRKILGKSDERDVENENIDIREYKSTKDEEHASFYLNVEGEILGGVSVPSKKARIVPSISEKKIPTEPIKPPTEEIPLPEQTGEDKIYIFIDSDNNNATGYKLSFFPIGADYMIEIKGRYGKVLSSRYFSFSGKKQDIWSWEDVGKIKVACGDKELETQLDLEELGIEDEFSVYFYTKDWDNNEDYSNDANRVKITMSIEIMPSSDGTRVVVWVHGYVYKSNGDPVPAGVTVTWYYDENNNGFDSGDIIGTDDTDSTGYYIISWDDNGHYPPGHNMRVDASYGGEYNHTDWFHDGSSDYSKDIHLIPEFSDIAIPIIGTIALFLTFRKRKLFNKGSP